MESCIPLPPLPEQKKIAEILSTWDTAIATVSRLIESKRALKKGLMQQLLTGKRRFPGFKEPWRKVLLGSLGIFTKGAGVSKDEVKPVGYPAIRYGELYTTHDIVVKNIASFIDDVSASLSKRIKYGDILFAGSGETADEIGKSAVFIGNDCAYAGGDVIVFSPDGEYPLFLAYLLNGSPSRQFLKSRGQGHSVVHIYSKDLAELPVSIGDVEEQKKVSHCLTSVENEIDLLIKVADQFKAQKRALMQKLLTGQVRVKVDEEVSG
jgi:type I restriction enzyme S subunit